MPDDEILGYERQLFNVVPTRQQLDRMLIERTEWTAGVVRGRNALATLLNTYGLRQDPVEVPALGHLDNATQAPLVPFVQAYGDFAAARALWNAPERENNVGWPELQMPVLPNEPTGAQLEVYLQDLGPMEPLRRAGLDQVRQQLKRRIENAPDGLNSEKP